MVYTEEFDAYNFEAWSGGKDTLARIIDEGKADELTALADEMFDADNPPTVTEINDWLWFDSDTIFEQLGITDEEEEEESEEDEESEDEESEDDSEIVDDNE